MGEIIGTIGGLLLFVLICFLFYNFLVDSNIIKKQKINCDLKFFIIAVVSLYVVQLLICGILQGFYGDNSIHLNNSLVWHNTIVFNELFNIDYDYGLSLIVQNGSTPLYYLIIRFVGSLVLNAYDDISFYIGFFCGLSSYMILYKIVHEYYKEKELLTLLLLIPGSIFLFVPTAFAVESTLLLLFIYCLLQKKNNYLLITLAILCLLFHIIGISTFIIYFLYQKNVKKFNNYLSAIVVFLTVVFLLIIGIILKWNIWYEFVPVLSLCFLLLTYKKLSKNSINMMRLIFIIINSYLILGLLIKIF